MRAHVLLTDDLRTHRPIVSSLLRSCARGLQLSGHTVVSGDWTGQPCDRLVLWGIGTPETGELAARARATGAHVISLDLAYWGRASPRQQRPYRMSIDAPHPQKFLMLRDRSSARWRELNVQLRSCWDPEGHVVLVGMGWKAARHYRESVGAWEERTAELVAAALPGRQLVFRPKPGDHRHCQSVPGLPSFCGPLHDLLSGAALVVCRHSNIGVDAIVAGVPVSTEDGAAAALCTGGYHLREPVDDRLRQSFVRNLAWFQWSEVEFATPAPWAVVEEAIADLEALR